MMKKSLLKLLSVTALAAAVSACTTTPTKVTAEGTTDNPVWPRWDSVTFDKNRGTFPNLASLKEIKAGMTKDQLYHLLGRPHYDEVWRPREWNYLFHFHTPGVGTDDVTTCQFKVLFDKDKFTRTFYWNPVDPVDAACPPAQIEPQPQIIIKEVPVPTPVPAPTPVVPVPAPAPVTPAPAPAPVPKIQRYTLNADALFVFDKHTLGDMLPKGRRDLDDLAARLHTFDELNAVIVTGHTDRLGTDAYNVTLSQNRAKTVVNYLISRGIPAQIIRSYGAGETEQIKQCSDSLPRQQLIDCLQPNRRVTVDVDGSGILFQTPAK